MELKITTLDGKEAGSVSLSDAIFGLEPRKDILQRCVKWQLAKRRAGTHAVKNRADIHRTGKKAYAQKGTGGARHGSMRANLFRGGGRSFGPVVRSHEIGLPKKVRALALRHALSAKAKDGGIVLIDKATVEGGKTKALKASFAKLGLLNALIIDGAEVDAGLRLAARNLPNIDVLPIQGINVYDILRRTKLVLTKAAVDALEARFK
jgi:large subunit ribosomal protein L4